MRRTGIFRFCSLACGTLITLALLWVTVQRSYNYYSAADLLFLKILAALVPAGFLAALFGIRRIRWNILDFLVLGWCTYIFYNWWFLSDSPSGRNFVSCAEMFFLYCALRLTLQGDRLSGKLLVAGLAVFGTFQSLLGLTQLYGLTPAHHWRFRITGTLFNPGPYSIYLAMVICICGIYWWRRRALGLFRRSKPWRKSCAALLRSLCVLAALCCAVALPATFSRAAFVALAAVLLVALWRNRMKGGARALRWAIPLLLAGAAGLYFLKRGSADGRVLIWLVSSQAIAARPVTGHGVGSFLGVYGAQQADFFARHPGSAFVDVAGAPEYPFNELLGVGVEQGVIGMLFFAAIAVLSFTRLLKRRDELAYGWLALLICSLASYPFALLPFRVLAVLFVARAANLERSVSGGCPQPAHAGRGGNVVAALCLCLAAGFFLPSAYSRITKKIEAVRAFRSGSPVTDGDTREWEELLSDNPRCLYDRALALRDAGRYNDSNAALRMGMRASSDNMFPLVMGDNYADLGAVELAEQSYRTAHWMAPRKLYPLHRLLQLYERNGMEEKARAVAARIVSARPRIRSVATADMQEYARNFLAGADSSGK